MMPSRQRLKYLAAFNNVVPAHGHLFPLNGCSEGRNVWITNLARSEILLLQETLHSIECVCWGSILLKHNSGR